MNKHGQWGQTHCCPTEFRSNIARGTSRSVGVRSCINIFLMPRFRHGATLTQQPRRQLRPRPGRNHQRVVRRRWFIDAVPGNPGNPWSWPPSNGCPGSIITDCSNPSDISRRPKLRQTTTGNSPVRPRWRLDSNSTASAILGAVQVGSEGSNALRNRY